MDPSDRNNAFLKNPNATSPTIPIINIYGNEDANRLVRLIGSALNKTEIDSYLNTTDKTYDETQFSLMDQKQGPYTRNIEVRGVNHLEMCRHPNMKLKLNEILNGKIYDEAFNPKNN